MTRAAIVILAVALAACSSSRSKEDQPSNIPPPQPVSPSTDARLNELQTSLTELLERLDVLNARPPRRQDCLRPTEAQNRNPCKSLRSPITTVRR